MDNLINEVCKLFPYPINIFLKITNTLLIPSSFSSHKHTKPKLQEKASASNSFFLEKKVIATPKIY